MVPDSDRGAVGWEALATRLYVNLAVADRAVEVATLPVDGVGLLRGEFMITSALDGIHPRRKLIADGESARFIDGMTGELSHDRRSVLPAAGRLPHDGLPDERVPQPRRAAIGTNRTRRTR